MSWKRLHVFLVIVGLWLLALPVLAQSGSVRIENPDNLNLDTARIRAAAERLTAEGAEVVVIAAGPSAGINGQFAQNYLNQYLDQQGIARASNDLNPNQIIFFVATEARTTGLLYGARWKQTLDPVQTRIRNEQMSPRFASGDLTAGFVEGMNAVRTTINPPTPTAVYVIGGVLVLAALGAVLIPLLRKRRATSDLLAAARERMEQARRAAGSAIADLGQLAETVDAKDDYDRLSYSQSDATQLQRIQGGGLQLFQDAQSAFDAAEEQTVINPPKRPQDYDVIAAQYSRAQELAQQALRPLREAESLRAALDARPAPSTGPTRRLGE